MSTLWDDIEIDPVTQRPKLGTARRRNADPLIDSHPDGNPCVRYFGAGPEGVTCEGCVHLFGVQYSRVYYKCDLRPISGGPGTDHRVRWPACAKYEPGENERYHPSH